MLQYNIKYRYNTYQQSGVIILTNTKSAKKSLIKSKNKRKYNISHRSMLRTFIKKINIAINKKNQTTVMAAFKKVQKIIDRQIHKGLIHKNKAARCKSRIHTRIQSMIHNITKKT